jgi:hypothetical protein
LRVLRVRLSHMKICFSALRANQSALLVTSTDRFL